jgi:hypothetical protein
MQHADALTVICEELARDVAARGIAAEKVTVIPNAVDTNTFSGRSSPDPELPRKLGPEGQTVSGFFGSYADTKRSWMHSVARYAPVYNRLMRGRLAETRQYLAKPIRAKPH